MRVVQLGCGITGLVCAEHLANNTRVTELVLADYDTGGAEFLAKRLDMDKVSVIKADGSDAEQVRKLLKSTDLVVNSLPWQYMGQVQRLAAETGTDYVDFCLTVEALKDFDSVDKMCKNAGITALLSLIHI